MVESMGTLNRTLGENLGTWESKDNQPHHFTTVPEERVSNFPTPKRPLPVLSEISPLTNANLQPKVDNLTKNRPGSGTKDQQVQRESYIIGGTNRERERKRTSSKVPTVMWVPKIIIT